MRQTIKKITFNLFTCVFCPSSIFAGGEEKVSLDEPVKREFPMIKRLFGNITNILFFAFMCCPFLIYPAEQKKICLNMIVKNESKIITRCLDSVKDSVDFISISDTGSTDQTVEIIEAYLKKYNIPGKVHHDEWKNFGHNRSLSVKAAQKSLQEAGFPLDKTYILLFDADMVLVKNPSFTLENLDADSYLLLQKNECYSYYNRRLIRASLPWECVGVTHEYWATKVPNRQLSLDTLEIDDREDGGSKSDKFIRDVKLLTQGLSDEPNNERYMFYLAQSYKCLGQYDNAIRWYKERIDKGGWIEEVWYSMFMIGESYQAKGDWNKALEYYLEAYSYMPDRAEPLHNISKYYLDHQKPIMAYPFALAGVNIPYPKNHSLFISHTQYEYELLEALSIAGNYPPYKTEGFNALNRLLLSRNIPKERQDLAYRNLVHYLENIKTASFIPITFETPPLFEGSTERYYAANPSIIRTDSGYKVICRTHNFKIENNIYYLGRDPSDSTIRTTNFLLEYDKNLNLISQKEIKEVHPRMQFPNHIQGLEDCRAVSLNGELFFTSSVFDMMPNKVVITLCKLDSNPSKVYAEVEKFLPLKSHTDSAVEKNWLPFEYNNKLFVVYSWSPFVIYETNKETGECKIAIETEPLQDLSYFRGSAPPIPYDEGYLMLVHEFVFIDRKYYTHRFVFLDKDLKISKMSKPFCFEHRGIEYCCGMTIDHNQTKLVMTIGIEDKEAKFCLVDLKTVDSMLEKVETKN
jgi:glycosyltransferase involved in cell wall biosynthesis